MKDNKELADKIANKLEMPIFDALCELYYCDNKETANKTREEIAQDEVKYFLDWCFDQDKANK